MTIDKALKVNPELRKTYEDDEQVKYLIDMCETTGRTAAT